MTTTTKPITPGGQHRPSTGVRTLDGETAAQQFERLRRSYAELGEPLPGERIRRCQTMPNQRTLVERFNELVEQSTRQLANEA